MKIDKSTISIHKDTKLNFYYEENFSFHSSELKTGRGHAFLETIHDEGETFRFSGWGIIMDGNVWTVPSRIIFTHKEKYIGFALTMVPREDVVASFLNKAPLQCGFIASIPRQKIPTDTQSIGIYAQQKDGRLVPLYDMQSQRFFPSFWDRQMPSFRKKVFYYGEEYYGAMHPQCGNLSGSELLISMGQNTGNQLFVRSIVKHLGAENIESRLDRAENCSIQVFSMANDIQANFEPNERLYNMMEKSNLPCCVIGIGAQADDYSHIPKLTPKMRRFLRMLSERSVSIGVRGAFSAECLNSIGIKNTHIIGCPSAFYNMRNQLPILTNAKNKQIKAVINVAHADKKGKFPKNSLKLLRYAFESNSPVVLQSTKFLISLANDNFTVSEWDQCKKLCERLNISGTDNELYDQMKSVLKVFWNERDWLDFLKKYDFVLGEKIHGCIAGVLAGVPALIIGIDSRTRELSDTLSLPWIDVQSVADISIHQLYGKADYSVFNSRYAHLYKNYIDFLNNNGVPHLL